MKPWKRFSALVLALVLLAALAVPAAAAPGSFSDVQNQTDAVNADILRFMGIVDGDGGNRFNPGGSLSRAGFCTMLVGIMGIRDKVPGYMNRTIFSDVASNHWARGFVNLAANTTVGSGDNAQRLISGVGNGKFEPDRDITFGEAVTILARVLGYTDAQVGNIWPNDYISKAAEIGLSKNVSASARGSITRAQAAQLFVNLLTCKKAGSSECYYTELGTANKDSILLSVSAELNGERGAVRTNRDTYLPANSDGTLPTSFVGQKGVEVVKDGLIVAFIPDSEKSVTVTLTEKASGGSLKASNGITYTVPGTTKVYTSGLAEPSDYAKELDKLVSGTQVTLYLVNGKVDGLYYTGTGSSAGGDAVIVSGTANAAMFHQLTGGVSNYRIMKDRQEILMRDIKPNDVVTYDPVSNTLQVSDLRITVYYEGAEPSVRAPEKIKVQLGTELNVLPCAVDSLTQFRTTDTMTLLLTADGNVAGAVPPSAQARSTAVGLCDLSGKVTIPLPAGGVIPCGSSNSSELYGRLVTVSTSRAGLSLARLSNKSAPGDFDLKAMTLGQYTVAAGAALYERVGANGAVVPLDLTGLDITSIPAGKVSTYSLNSANMVDVLVVDNVTGNVYNYGIFVKGERTQGEGGLTATNTTVRVRNADGESTECLTGIDFKEGAFGGVAVGGWDSLNNINRAAAIITLNEIRNVPSSAFYTTGGMTYVNANGRVYPVSGQVSCYNNATKGWFSDLDDARAFADTLTLYVDPIGNMVRIVTAK